MCQCNVDENIIRSSKLVSDDWVDQVQSRRIAKESNYTEGISWRIPLNLAYSDEIAD